MMVHFDLTGDDAKLLLDTIAGARRRIEDELVHTDARSMQSDLARDLEGIERVQRLLARALDISSVDAVT